MISVSTQASGQYLGNVVPENKTGLADNQPSSPAERRIGSFQALNSMFELKSQQYAEISKENLSITFLEVIEDSRCPSDVTCVWQGKTTLRFDVSNKTQGREITLTTNGEDKTYVFDKYKIQLVDVKPYPTSTKTIKQEDYIAIVKVTYNNQVQRYENDLIPKLTPLKQFKAGIPLDKIQCREGLVLVTKSTNDSPACVKPETKQKLIERGWGTMTYLDKTMKVQGTDLSVKYRIDGNATVTDSIYSKDSASVIVTLDTVTSGILIVELPRTLIDSGHSNCDPNYEREEPFAILIDHEEVSFDEIATTPEKRTLSISFQENTEKIEIIAFCLI